MLKPSEVPDAVATAEAEMKPYTDKIGGTDVTFDMVPIPGGKFKMGSPEGEADRKADEGPQIEVEIEPFWMGKHEVTWDEYEMWGMGLDQQRRRVLGLKASEYDDLADTITMPTKPYTDMTFGMGRDGYPAICMTQLSAKMYCKWLSAKTGRYYRLPTEAEWEYACRAGATTAYSFGDDPDDLDDYGWYYDNADDKYQQVGQKKPNPWGLYDMHGNVAEWVLDGYSAEGYKAFAGKSWKNPVAPAKEVFQRVVRGGSWFDDADRLRSAARAFSEEDWKAQDPQIPQSIWYMTDADFVGFRVVRPLRTPTAEEAARYDIDQVQKEGMAEYAAAKGSAAP
jgi:formylglycine-generating enzyme required for sulfatase activity